MKEIIPGKTKFKISDIVGTSRWKSHFEAGYTKRETNEPSKMVDILDSSLDL